MSPREVITTHRSKLGQLSFIELSVRIKRHIDSQTLTVAEFEEKVGWAVESALSNPDEFWRVTLQCLIDICAELQIDWLTVVPD